MLRVLFVHLFSIASGVCSAGILYYTGFETNSIPPSASFPTGFDIFYAIPSPDEWKASAAHSGLRQHSIEPESVHTQRGMGKVVYLGGNTTPFAVTSTNQTVRVWRIYNLDPVATNQEIVTFSVLLGINDSTSTAITFLPRRDNFEFSIYNQANQLIGFIQFDNNTLNTSIVPPEPTRRILRSKVVSGNLSKIDTGDVFYHDTIMNLVVRINFRTNRWTAYLDDVALFSDELFYSGNNARNLGSLAAQMQVMNQAQSTTFPFTQQRAPGDNFMLFDDLLVRADRIPDTEIYDFARNAAGSVSFTWLTEAQYRYQVQYRDDLASAWLDTLANSLSTATTTGTAPAFTDTAAARVPRRFYRINRMYP